jgi:hypothetical protein
MVSRFRTSLHRLLTYRYIYGRRITPETRVDPAAFPEEEFPVYCRKCRYLLRGQPDGRCPECGSEFHRGRLLVEQYALGRTPRPDRLRRIAMWLSIVGFATGLGSILILHLAVLIIARSLDTGTLSPRSSVDCMMLLFRILFPGMVASPALLLGAAVLWVIAAIRLSGKARKVAEAIRAEEAGGE